MAQIRESELYDIIKIDKYEYNYFPSVNIKGAYIKIYSGKDFEEINKDFGGLPKGDLTKIAEFANKWLDIGKYKNIKYK